MILGTFNGWNIVALPSYPAFVQTELVMQSKVDATPNAWSQQAQIIDWQVDYWEGTVSLPPMQRSTAQAWMAFLAEVRGMAGVFQIGDQVGATPLGSVRSNLTASTGLAARSTTLFVGGLPANVYGVLRAGDYLQVGYRLHIALEDVDSDDFGNGGINIWPSLREAVTNGDAITVLGPKGLFRLAENKRSANVAVDRLYTISFGITEAL